MFSEIIELGIRVVTDPVCNDYPIAPEYQNQWFGFIIHNLGEENGQKRILINFESGLMGKISDHLKEQLLQDIKRITAEGILINSLL